MFWETVPNRRSPSVDGLAFAPEPLITGVGPPAPPLLLPVSNSRMALATAGI